MQGMALAWDLEKFPPPEPFEFVSDSVVAQEEVPSPEPIPEPSPALVPEDTMLAEDTQPSTPILEHE